MNKKDHKAIAEIIKLDTLDINRIPKEQKDKNFYEGMNVAIQNQRSKIIKLADYFEKEEKRRYYYENDLTESEMEKEDYEMLSFNKEQFLKDCGVEE